MAPWPSTAASPAWLRPAGPRSSSTSGVTVVTQPAQPRKRGMSLHKAPRRVHITAQRLLKGNLLNRRPAWLSAVLQHPPGPSIPITSSKFDTRDDQPSSSPARQQQQPLAHGQESPVPRSARSPKRLKEAS